MSSKSNDEYAKVIANPMAPAFFSQTKFAFSQARCHWPKNAAMETLLFLRLSANDLATLMLGIAGNEVGFLDHIAKNTDTSAQAIAGTAQAAMCALD